MDMNKTLDELWHKAGKQPFRAVSATADVDLGGKAHELHDRAVNSDTVKSVSERVHQASEPIAAVLHKATDAVTERT